MTFAAFRLPSSHTGQWHRMLRTHPAAWPRGLRCCLYLLMFLLPLLTGGALFLEPALQMQQALQEQQQQQQMLYRQKLQQSHQLSALETQRQQLQMRIQHLLSRIQDSGDPHILLGEVATLAAAHQLLLEHVQPASAADLEHSAGTALQLRLRGSYHDIGRFSAALAAAARPLWLTDIRLAPAAEDDQQLRLEAFVLRYLPPRQHEPGPP